MSPLAPGIVLGSAHTLGAIDAVCRLERADTERSGSSSVILRNDSYDRIMTIRNGSASPSTIAMVALLLVAPLAACVTPAADPAPRTFVVPGDVLTVEKPSAAPPPRVDGSVVTPDGRTRSYHAYVPDSVETGPDATTVPLLLAFHGGGGSGTQFQRNAGFAQLAEANGFIVVYPDGVGTGPDETRTRTWNAGICCGAATRNNVDDVTFVRTLIDKLEDSYPIDPNRVFATGHSNGAMLTYRLACELSDRVSAIAVQAGALSPNGCKPAHPVSVLHIHGTDDPNVPISGGVGPNSVAGVDFPPPMEATKTFARADGCSAAPKVETSRENTDVKVTRWTGCTSRTTVVFLAVKGANHAWMGPTGGSGRTGPAYTDLASSATAWNFLIQHPRR